MDIRDLQASSDPQKVTVSAGFALRGSQHVSVLENSRAMDFRMIEAEMVVSS